MKTHQKVFEALKKLLVKELDGKITEHDDGLYVEIDGTPIWFSADEKELTIGYGIIHNHFDPEYDNIANAIDRLFNLLTCRIKVTYFKKGSFPYKHIIEIEHPDGEIEHIGTGMAWLYPFWRKTKKEIDWHSNLVEGSRVKQSFAEIKNMHNKL